MQRSIDVMLGDTPRRVGVLRHTSVGSREHAAFEYTADWLAAADRFCIDPTLRLVSGPQFPATATHSSLFHAAIADTEPDGLGKESHPARPSEAAFGGA